MKRLLFRFLVFLGLFSLLGKLNFMVVVVAVGAGMACMAFVHFLATPSAESSSDSAAS
jgi:hypothetical protein